MKRKTPLGAKVFIGLFMGSVLFITGFTAFVIFALCLAAEGSLPKEKQSWYYRTFFRSNQPWQNGETPAPGRRTNPK